MIVKILGAIDIAAALAFLLMIFGLELFFPYLMFCSGLLFLKGLFAFTGDVLSFVDLVASVSLLLSLLFGLPIFLIWTLAFLLLGKGFVSFI